MFRLCVSEVYGKKISLSDYRKIKVLSEFVYRRYCYFMDDLKGSWKHRVRFHGYVFTE